MGVSNRVLRAELMKALPTMSVKQLCSAEVDIQNRMLDCDRFYPWPALKESFAQDIAAIWTQHALRPTTNK